MQLNKKNNLSAKINRSVSPSRSPKSTPSSPLAKSSTNPSSRVFEKEKAKSSPAESKIGYTHISIRPVVNPVHHEVKEIVGFNFLGKNILIDKVCVAGWLSNHYPLSQENTMSGVPKTFLNAEAAFQAYKFTRITGVVDEFTTLDAAQALERKGAYKADKTFGGCGNKWKAMLAVLKAKFRNPALRSALLATGSAFLLNHPSAAGSDKTWSDNYDGTGCNGLGLGLMIVRDSLRGVEYKVPGGRFLPDAPNPLADLRENNPVWSWIVAEASETARKAERPLACSECDYRTSQPALLAKHGEAHRNQSSSQKPVPSSRSMSFRIPPLPGEH